MSTEKPLTEDEKAQRTVDRFVAQAIEDCAGRAEALAGDRKMRKVKGPNALRFFAQALRGAARDAFPHCYTEEPDAPQKPH